MVTSNLDFREWGDVFPANRMLGCATLDRLRHGAYGPIVEGESYRASRSPPEIPKKAVAKHPKIAQS
jgi:DNA replication protein DnaC